MDLKKNILVNLNLIILTLDFEMNTWAGSVSYHQYEHIQMKNKNS